jgi:hypothetical protein
VLDLVEDVVRGHERDILPAKDGVADLMDIQQGWDAAVM